MVISGVWVAPLQQFFLNTPKVSSSLVLGSVFSNAHHLTVANITRLKLHIAALNKYLLKVLAGRLPVCGEGCSRRES